jgi:MFS family permease
VPLLLDWSPKDRRRLRSPRSYVVAEPTSRLRIGPRPHPVPFGPRPAAHPPRRTAHVGGGLGRPYQLLLGAGTISSLGDGVAFVAFPLLATTLTHSAALIAGVAVAARLPWLLVALPAGALADRLDRRRLLTTIEVARMAILMALGLSIATHHVDLAQIYLAAFILGSLETGFVATTQALLPEILPGEALAKGNGRLFAGQMTGEQFGGPALGGAVFAVAAALPFVADGITFAASAALLALALPRRRRPARTGDSVTPAVHHSLLVEVRQGVSWLVRHPILRLVAALVATFAFCQAMGLAILVVYGLRVLHLTGTAFGLFVAAGATGNLLGALAAHRVVARRGTGPVLIAAGALAGIAFVVVGATSSLALALAAFILEAVAVGVGNVASLSLRQSMIPRHLAGRVNAALRMCISGAAALGAVAGGVIATLGTAQSPFVIGGVLELAAGLAIGVPLARLLGAHRPGTDFEVEPWVSAPGDLTPVADSEVA